ncbi:MAG: ROK family protein [Cyanobacteriota bacterium]
MKNKYRIGVDLGGTNIKAGIVDDLGNILFSTSIPTDGDKGFEATYNNIVSIINTILDNSPIAKNEVRGIGFGCPGLIDSVNGVVRELPNLPGWVNIHLSEMITNKFNLYTKIDNDVRAAALGEYKFGAGQGYSNLICITIGTGIGSGIILDGKLIKGSNLCAGEIGHMTLQEHGGPICGCGNTGCLEALGSASSIVRRATELLSGGRPSKIREIMGDGPLTPSVVAEAAQKGDAPAQRILFETGRWIGIGLANVVNLLNPEIIIIGGGVANAGEYIFNPIRETISKRSLKLPGNSVLVEPARLGESAGTIGSSLFVSDLMETPTLGKKNN